MSTSASSRCSARHQPEEGRIYYPFHPRCGETVLILRRYAYRGTELVVIPQPDGSVACIPAWMTNEAAAHFKLSAEPRFSLEILRCLRAEIDALLGFSSPTRRWRKKAMARKTGDLENPQLGLFDREEPSVALTLARKTQLAMLVEALLIEIAAALALKEAGAGSPDYARADRPSTGGHVRVHAGGAKRALHQVKAVEPQLFRCRCLRRPAGKAGEVLDAPDVVLLGVLSDMPGGHVLDHALTKRADTHTQLLS